MPQRTREVTVTITVKDEPEHERFNITFPDAGDGFILTYEECAEKAMVHLDEKFPINSACLSEDQREMLKQEFKRMLKQNAGRRA